MNFSISWRSKSEKLTAMRIADDAVKGRMEGAEVIM
jgi:hypothetical protein